MADERKLVRLAKKGDTDAFEQLVEMHSDRIYSIALRMVGNPTDAEDLAQEAFLRIWRGLEGFNMDSKFSTWAYRLTTNVCIDFLRKEKKNNNVSLFTEDDDGEESELEIADERYSPQQKLEQDQLRQTVDRAMNSLDPQYRQILTLRELGGLSYDEIAQQLGLKEGTVKSRIARAREQMRKLLTADGNFFGSDSSDKMKGGMTRG
ncbi:MAG: sigma-70 family RNA polymerase sigma factor [Ruminococcaceae bacterium]|nr:sigma-70 family RNA polymerase sigma factor [Oscillospiraceae bacterium]